MRILLIIIGILLCAPVSALLVGDITITPNQSVMIGGPVSASFNLTLSPYDRYTTNPDNTIIFSTSLENAVWTRSLVVEAIPGQIITSEGNTFNMDGWQLAYPLGTPEVINITIQGIAPNISSSQARTVFQVTEYSNGTQISGTESSFSILVINPTDISYIVSKEQADLEELKTELSEQGYEPNTSAQENTAAEALYVQAASGISYLQSLKPEEYPQAVSRAKEVDRAIQDAKDMLIREAVQAKINRAAQPLNRTAVILGWFASKTSTQNYKGLSNVSQQYRQSLSLLTQATEAMNKKEWGTAGDNATQAFTLSNQTLYAATALQKRAMDPLTPFWDNLWIIITVIGIFLVYTLLFVKKPKKPKEGSP